MGTKVVCLFVNFVKFRTWNQWPKLIKDVTLNSWMFIAEMLFSGDQETPKPNKF